jgi:hypothetical protein
MSDNNRGEKDNKLRVVYKARLVSLSFPEGFLFSPFTLHRFSSLPALLL